MSVVLEEVAQGYGNSVVIDQLSIRLEPGITALLGPNGAGKTTLLRTLATVLPPRSGSLSIDGVAITGERAARSIRDRIGYLPQEFGFDPRMTTCDFVEYAAWLRGIPDLKRGDVVREALAKVDLSEQRRARMGKLSGGMQRRAGIAWAIVGSPRLVLLDEPTAGLDPRQRLQFRHIVAGLRESIVVLSTHLIDDIEAIGDRVVVLHSGTARFDGTVAELTELGRADVPGHSPLERAYMHLLPSEEQWL